MSAKEHGYHRTREVRTLGTQDHVYAFPTVALQIVTQQLPRFRALGEVKPLRPALVDVLQVAMEKMTVQVSRVCDRSGSSPSMLARLVLI